MTKEEVQMVIDEVQRIKSSLEATFGKNFQKPVFGDSVGKTSQVTFLSVDKKTKLITEINLTDLTN